MTERENKNKYVRFDPVTSLAAAMALGQQVIIGLQYLNEWSGTATGIVGGIWTAFIAFVGSPLAKARVTNNTVVTERANKLAHDTIVALAPGSEPPVPPPPPVGD